jgi:hypothetical protein
MVANLSEVPVGDQQTAPGPEVFDSFKDSQGRFRTQSLFIEYPHESYPAFFTLKKQDKKGAISMYRKYMEIGDPTEYQVAIQLLGSWDHWQALTRTKWFRTHLTGWRKELKARMESDRYYEMVDKKNDPGALGIQATKWLAERYGGSSDKVAKRGRPSKEEKAAHLRRLSEEADDINDDARRIGVV